MYEISILTVKLLKREGKNWELNPKPSKPQLDVPPIELHLPYSGRVIRTLTIEYQKFMIYLLIYSEVKTVLS